MTELNLVQAVNAALRAEMRRDERVVILGEDVGKLGGVFRATRGLYEEFGQARVIDTPLAENGIIGAAIGMALHGLRPVAEIQFSDFIYPAFDQIVSEAAKYRYRSGGQFAVPMVIRAPIGGGVAGGMYHSQSPEALFIHTPGLKVVCPSTPYDAKGLLISAMRDEDPVLFFEPKRLYRGRPMPVPGEDYTIPLGRARVVRPGRDVTLVAWGAMVVEAFETAEELAPLGVDCEVIDLRTLWPLDLVSLEQSTKKTGRLLVVHEAPLTCGFGAELVALLSQRCFDYLRAPPERVTGWDIPFGYARELDYLPLKRRIKPTVLEVVQFGS